MAGAFDFDMHKSVFQYSRDNHDRIKRFCFSLLFSSPLLFSPIRVKQKKIGVGNQEGLEVSLQILSEGAVVMKLIRSSATSGADRIHSIPYTITNTKAIQQHNTTWKKNHQYRFVSPVTGYADRRRVIFYDRTMVYDAPRIRYPVPVIIVNIWGIPQLNSTTSLRV